LTPFAANVSLAFDDVRNLMKFSAASQAAADTEIEAIRRFLDRPDHLIFGKTGA